MKEEILTLLKENMSLDINAIAKKLKIKDKIKLKEELTNLVNEGTLDYSERKNKYLLFENSHLKKAYIGKRDKFDNATVKIDNQIFKISKKDLKGANYNDLVALEIDELSKQAKVSRIIKKDSNNYVAEVIVKKDKLYLYSQKLGLIDIKQENLVEGQLVLIRHEEGRNKILEVIGHKDDPKIDIKAILYDHGFTDEINESLQQELKNIPTELSTTEITKELKKGRVDHRDKTIVTIDGDDTKDIDDGVSIEKLPNGNFKLSIYIADVAHYVKEDCAIDQDAYRRATSVYPPNSVSPMLDHKLSNGICSLNPNTDRLAMCYTTTFNKFGKVIDFQVEESIINSKKKMTYSAINDILLNEIIKEDYKQYLKDIYIMYELSLLIYNNFLQQGYLNFLSKESKVILDEFGFPIDITMRETGPAQKIIEMFMIITNIELTKYAHFLNLPWIYRIHDEPKQEKLITTYNILNFKHYLNSKEKKNYTRNDILKTIEILSKYENADVFNRMLITCQDKAKYSDENIGHYALAANYYSHNTSPIRRYPDLQNQRIIKNFLHESLEHTQKKYADLKETAIHCSIQEREAALVEREATDIKKAEYIENHIGETFTGYITYVSENGFWVELDNTIEGFIHKNDLPKDNYKYSSNILSLIGKNNIYSIGDKIEIKVKKASKENGYIDFIPSITYQKENTTNNIKTRKKVKN